MMNRTASTIAKSARPIIAGAVRTAQKRTFAACALKPQQHQQPLRNNSIGFVARQQTRCYAVTTINVPSMGDSISDGIIQKLVKKPGDYAKEDEVLVEIETDKVTVEVRAPQAGVVKGYLAQEGAKVDVGSALVEFDVGAEAPAGAAKPAETAAAPKAEKAEKKEEKPAAAPAKAAAPAPAAAAPKPAAVA